jgi:hypothetical protein
MTWLNNLFGEKGKNMSALIAGTKAPSFELPAMDGSNFPPDALRGPVLPYSLKSLALSIVRLPVLTHSQNYASPAQHRRRAKR